MAFVISVPIPIQFPISIPMPKFQCPDLQMAIIFHVIKKIKKVKKQYFLKAHSHLLKIVKKWTNSIVRFLPSSTRLCHNIIT